MEKEYICMNLTVEMLDGGIKKINLFGRMDVDGTQEIELGLTSEAAIEKAFVILDLSKLEFMASLGIGSLLSVAKSLKRRNGKMVLMDPQPVVALVLERTQIQKIIPICHGLEHATKILMDPAS